MIRNMLALVAALWLAACGGSIVDNAAVEVGDLNATVAGPTVAETLARGNDSVAAEPLPIGFDERGRWAATPTQCAGAAWRFTKDGASDGGGAQCRVQRRATVSRSSTRLELACRAEGIATIETWALNLHDDGSMSVARSEGGNGVPRSVLLRRCG